MKNINLKDREYTKLLIILKNTYTINNSEGARILFNVITKQGGFK